MRKFAEPKSYEFKRMVAVGTTAWLVTNGYGNFWIEMELPHGERPQLLLDALSTAGWTVDQTINIKPRTLIVKTGHTRDDDLEDNERRVLITKAKRDLKELGVENILEVDRGI
jgi:hypothetical protein